MNCHQHKVAYLVSEYPAASLTFILREVRTLREQGMTIITAAINPPDRPPERLTEEERVEAANTYVVKRDRLYRLLPALVGRTLHPTCLYRGIKRAIVLAGWDLGRQLKHLAYLAEALLVGDWMSQQKVSHLHVHFANPAATVALLVQELYGHSYSMTVHGPDIFYDAKGLRLQDKFTNARFISCISDYCRSQVLLNTPPERWERIITCRLGIDPQMFQVESMSKPNTPPTVLCVGRLVPAKGQHVLIEAIAQLKREGLPVSTIFVGGGPEQKHLEHYAKQLSVDDLVIFEGVQPPDRIRSYLASADLFVLPSFAEGVPVALMEAMAAGIPCISTRITGIPELIRDGIDGLLVPPSNAPMLAKAIRELLIDEKLRSTLTSSAKARVCEHYNLIPNVNTFREEFCRRLQSGREKEPS